MIRKRCVIASILAGLSIGVFLLKESLGARQIVGLALSVIGLGLVVFK